MTNELEFPLRIWERTEEFQEVLAGLNDRLQRAKTRLYGRGFTGTSFGDVRITPSGNLAAWLNCGRPYARRRPDADSALESALRYGTTGYWEVKDVEEFAKGEGVILEKAMHDLGFRRHKKIRGKWSRRSKEECFPSSYEAPETLGEEARRLIVEPNVKPGERKTYWASGDEYGIFVQFNVSPFMATSFEQMEHQGRLQRIRGHIARKQEGFTLEARTVSIDEERFVHVKSVRADGYETQCLWPSVIPAESYREGEKPALYHLADRLVAAVRARGNGSK